MWQQRAELNCNKVEMLNSIAAPHLGERTHCCCASFTCTKASSLSSSSSLNATLPFLIRDSDLQTIFLFKQQFVHKQLKADWKLLYKELIASPL